MSVYFYQNYGTKLTEAIKMVQCDKSCDAKATKSIGEVVRTVLATAMSAHRITLGFSDAIKLLSNTPEEAQFCFLAEPKRGDSATHIHEVLLQAFCYEHGIYMIKVDSGQKLAHVLGTMNADETCVLIRNGSATTTIEESQNDTDDITAQLNVSDLSADEDVLVNFCENAWHNSDYCIVKLPES